jgi:DNA-binding MarR family transcriptional regulator
MTDERLEALRLDNQLCFAVYSTAHALTRAYKPLLEPLGLTYPQYLVMLVLWEQDGLLVKEIGARLHLDSGTLTPLLKRLEAAGHLRRTREQADERQVRVTLTDAGRDLRAAAIDVPAGIACAAGESVAEIPRLRAGLTAFRDGVNAAVG